MPRQINKADDIRRLIASLHSDISHIKQVASDDSYFNANLKRLDEQIDELQKQRAALIRKREKCDELVEHRQGRIAVLTRQLSLESNKGELNKLAAKIAKFEKAQAKAAQQ